MTTKVQTKFGTATLCGNGYYYITSRKEGNNGKKLCRVVFEDFYNIKLSANEYIHHLDGDKTNDKIWNLIVLSANEHTSLHNRDKNYNGDFKVNVSKSKNTTGFFRVMKGKTGKNNRMGYSWRYVVQTNNKKTIITAASLLDLKEKVLSQGFKWMVIDEILAEQSREETRQYYLNEQNSSGIFNVYKHKDKSCKQGFIWEYHYYDENGKKRRMSNVKLDKLKSRVLSKGLDWIVFDELITKVDSI